MQVGLSAADLSSSEIGQASISPWPKALSQRLSVHFEIYVDDKAMGQEILRLVFEGSRRTPFETSFISTYRSSPGPLAGRKVHVEQSKLISLTNPAGVVSG